MDTKKDEDNSGPVSEPETRSPAVVGDVIGSTAYSERFVLRLLLKFSEISMDESVLEEELCTLWDMTAERDVVDFLLKHNFTALVRFAWPSVLSARTAEILVGVLANMCCFADAIRSLRADPDFCATLVQLVHSDDTPVLVQLLRLINACLHGAGAADTGSWLELFAATEFPTALAFILANSANKELLATALESLNVICSTCNVETTRAKFYELFVREYTVDGLHGCFEELTLKQLGSLERHERERLYLVSLELTMHMAGFDKSIVLYENKKNNVCSMITHILEHYSTKIVCDKEIDLDFTDVVQSANTINSLLHLHRDCDTEKSFKLLYRVWKALKYLSTPETEPNFEDNSLPDDIKVFSNKLNGPLCCYVCNFLQFCPLATFKNSLNMIDKDIDYFLNGTGNHNLSESVRIRTQESV